MKHYSEESKKQEVSEYLRGVKKLHQEKEWAAAIVRQSLADNLQIEYYGNKRGQVT